MPVGTLPQVSGVAVGFVSSTGIIALSVDDGARAGLGGGGAGGGGSGGGSSFDRDGCAGCNPRDESRLEVGTEAIGDGKGATGGDCCTGGSTWTCKVERGATAGSMVGSLSCAEPPTFGGAEFALRAKCEIDVVVAGSASNS